MVVEELDADMLGKEVVLADGDYAQGGVGIHTLPSGRVVAVRM